MNFGDSINIFGDSNASGTQERPINVEEHILSPTYTPKPQRTYKLRYTRDPYSIRRVVETLVLDDDETHFSRRDLDNRDPLFKHVEHVPFEDDAPEMEPVPEKAITPEKPDSPVHANQQANSWYRSPKRYEGPREDPLTWDEAVGMSFSPFTLFAGDNNTAERDNDLVFEDIEF